MSSIIEWWNPSNMSYAVRALENLPRVTPRFGLGPIGIIVGVSMTASLVALVLTLLLWQKKN
ncbi:MAG: hypothetical protein JSW01_03085 [Candidatus Bathyarchaeota archaeon]|nr:MAG: hypothetical protein JSW01_03085 [Candidatus Bathyarchaeota archaeon]